MGRLKFRMRRVEVQNEKHKRECSDQKNEKSN
jgi:hypothetical protein